MTFFTATELATLAGTDVRVALLVEFQFDSGAVRVWNGFTSISAGGQTWEPMKGSGSIDGLPVSDGEASNSVTLTVSGVPDGDVDFLAKALEETPDVNQRTVLIYIQLFDDEWQPSGNPIALWWGFMQPPQITETAAQDVQGQIRSISVVAENAFFNRSRAPFGRYTDRDQQKRSAGDKFLQFISGLLFRTYTYPDY